MPWLSQLELGKRLSAAYTAGWEDCAEGKSNPGTYGSHGYWVKLTKTDEATLHGLSVALRAEAIADIENVYIEGAKHAVDALNDTASWEDDDTLAFCPPEEVETITLVLPGPKPRE